MARHNRWMRHWWSKQQNGKNKDDKNSWRDQNHIIHGVKDMEIEVMGRVPISYLSRQLFRKDPSLSCSSSQTVHFGPKFRWNDGHPKMVNRTSAINSMISSTDRILIISSKLQQTLVEVANQSDHKMVHLYDVVGNMLTYCPSWVQRKQSWLTSQIRHQGTGRIHTRYQVRWLNRVPMTHQALLTILSSHNLVHERYNFKLNLIPNSQLIAHLQLIAI